MRKYKKVLDLSMSDSIKKFSETEGDIYGKKVQTHKWIFDSYIFQIEYTNVSDLSIWSTSGKEFEEMYKDEVKVKFEGKKCIRLNTELTGEQLTFSSETCDENWILFGKGWFCSDGRILIRLNGWRTDIFIFDEDIDIHSRYHAILKNTRGGVSLYKRI